MDNRVSILLEKAEKDSSEMESLITLMSILAATYRWVDDVFYSCIPEDFRNTKVEKKDEKELLNRLLTIINHKGENMEVALRCIYEIKTKERDKLVCKLFENIDLSWKIYPDFLGTLIFTLETSPRDLIGKYKNKIIEFYECIDDNCFHETVERILIDYIKRLDTSPLIIRLFTKIFYTLSWWFDYCYDYLSNK